MFIKLTIYNNVIYTEGAAYSTPGKPRKTTSPDVIIFNTDSIESISYNKYKNTSTHPGGLGVGISDYVIRTQSGMEYYIMQAEANKVMRIVGV